VGKKPIVILCTTPDMQSAKEIAQYLVEEKLAACCNILPEITSVYSWQGTIEQASEHVLLIKTQSNNFKKLEAAILKRHPYELPEIIGIDITKGSQKYLDWISENVR